MAHKRSLTRRDAIDMTAGKQILSEYNLTDVQIAQLVAEQRLQNPPPLDQSLYRMLRPGAAHTPTGAPKSSPKKPHLSRGLTQRLGGAQFHPNSGSNDGVVLPQCLSNPSAYVQDAELPIVYVLPRALHKIVINTPETFFVVDWPGYNHLNLRYNFKFMQDNGCMITVGQMAMQIAEIYQWWYRDYHHKFREARGAVRVGPGAAKYEKMYLRELSLVEGAQNLWKAEVVYR